MKLEYNKSNQQLGREMKCEIKFFITSEIRSIHYPMIKYSRRKSCINTTNSDEIKILYTKKKISLLMVNFNEIEIYGTENPEKNEFLEIL